MTLKLRRAELHDVPVLHAMADRFLLSRLDPEAIERHGFLVSNFGAATYRSFLERADHFYVLEDEEGIGAFILAYGSDCPEDDEDQAEIRRRYPGPFVLIKQICVRPERSGRGYAARLYDYVLEASGGLPQFAAVVLEPYNPPSVAFHERMGFREMFRLRAADGMLRAIFARGVEPQG